MLYLVIITATKLNPNEIAFIPKTTKFHPLKYFFYRIICILCHTGILLARFIVFQKNLKRPTIPAEFGSKVPISVRQRYLNTIIDECLPLYVNEEDAFKRVSLHLEFNCKIF